MAFDRNIQRSRKSGGKSADSDVGTSTITQRHTAPPDEAARARVDAAWASVQMARDGHTGLDDADVQRAAAHGVADGGSQLPHLEAIQRSFGEHDVSGVQAHTGAAATEANQAMGAHAYATGNDVAFADSNPSLFLVAHEAAHVVQQRAGVSLKGAVGQVGDSYEQHADAVASRVVAGESAADLLGPVAGGGGAAVQRDDNPDAKGGVPTSWYATFKGAAAHGKVGNHAERTSDDVLAIDGMSIGSLHDPQRIQNQGNALTDGEAHIKDYDHPKGKGIAHATVRFTGPSDIAPVLTWGVKPGAGDAAKADAAHKAVIEYVKKELSNPAGKNHGDWDAIRQGAAGEAETKLPEHAPVVTFTVNKATKPLTVPEVVYQIARPSDVIVNFTVPTTTQSKGTWSVTKDDGDKQTHGADDHSGAKVEGTAGGSSSQKQDVGTNVQVGGNHQDTNTTTDNTKQKVSGTMTKSEIETLGIDISNHIHKQITVAWTRMISNMQNHPGGGKVGADGDDASPSLWDRAKGWAKKKVKDGLWAGAKSAIKWGAKTLIKKVIPKAVEVEEWWIVPLGWAVGWGVDKIRGHVEVDKSEDKKTPPHTPDPSQTYPLEQAMQYASERTTSLKSETTKQITESITVEYERDHGTSATHSSGGSTNVGVTTGNENTKEQHGEVKGSIDAARDTHEGDEKSAHTSRTYSGENIQVVAGQPIMSLQIDEK